MLCASNVFLLSFFGVLVYIGSNASLVGSFGVVWMHWNCILHFVWRFPACVGMEAWIV